MIRTAAYQWTFHKSTLDQGKTVFDARHRNIRNDMTGLHLRDIELDRENQSINQLAKIAAEGMGTPYIISAPGPNQIARHRPKHLRENLPVLPRSVVPQPEGRVG